MSGPATVVHSLVLPAHIALGAIALVTFWIAIFSRKGGPRHVLVGKIYEWAMYGTALSACLLCVALLTDPLGIHPPREGADPVASAATRRAFAWFLAYLAWITFATTRHGVRTIRTRGDPSPLQRPAYRAFGGLTIAAGAAAIFAGFLTHGVVSILFLSLSPIGLFFGTTMMRYSANPRSTRREAWYQHIGGMIGSGIAVHTAFLVFGAGRYLQGLPGALAWIPWLGPTLVGVPAIFIWIAYYKRRFEK